MSNERTPNVIAEFFGEGAGLEFPRSISAPGHRRRQEDEVRELEEEPGQAGGGA